MNLWCDGGINVNLKGPILLAVSLVAPVAWLSWSLGNVTTVRSVVVTPRPSLSPASPKVLGATTPEPALPSPSAVATPVTQATPRPTPRPATGSGTGTNPGNQSGAPDIATEAACPGQSDTGRSATVLACMTSFARTYHGLTAVSTQATLAAAASAKVQDMINCGYGHTACGKAFDYWITAKGFTGRCSAENIAQGLQTPRAVFVAWMNSAGHRANILNPDYRYIGIGAASSSSGMDWVMQLGGC